MPLYIAKSGDLEGCHACLTDSLTHSHLKDRATQLLIKYKSGALVTQLFLLMKASLNFLFLPWCFGKIFRALAASHGPRPTCKCVSNHGYDAAQSLERLWSFGHLELLTRLSIMLVFFQPSCNSYIPSFLITSSRKCWFIWRCFQF